MNNIPKQTKYFLILIWGFLITCNVGNAQTNSSPNDKEQKFAITGEFGIHSKNHHRGQSNEVVPNLYDYGKQSDSFIKLQSGLFLSSKFQIGLGFEYSWKKKAREKRDISYTNPDENYTRQFLVDKKDISTFLYFRYQDKVAKNLNYYADLEVGMDFNLQYSDKCIDCPACVIEGEKSGSSTAECPNYNEDGNDVFTRISAGIIYDISNWIALQTEVASFAYRVDHRVDPSSKAKTTKFETILSNPNIGLVFYF